MEEFSYHLDGDTYLEVMYEIIPGERETEYSPPVYPEISIQRAFLVRNSWTIEITEFDGHMIDIQWDTIRDEIENTLRNA